MVNVNVLRCHHGICGSLGCCPKLSFDSSLARNIFCSFSPWEVLSLAQICCLFTKIHSMIRFEIAPKFSHDSGFGWLEDSHRATIKISRYMELRRMIIGRIIHVKPAFKWVPHVAFLLTWLQLRNRGAPAFYRTCLLRRWHLLQ